MKVLEIKQTGLGSVAYWLAYCGAVAEEVANCAQMSVAQCINVYFNGDRRFTKQAAQTIGNARFLASKYPKGWAVRIINGRRHIVGVIRNASADQPFGWAVVR